MPRFHYMLKDLALCQDVLAKKHTVRMKEKVFLPICYHGCGTSSLKGLIHGQSVKKCRKWKMCFLDGAFRSRSWTVQQISWPKWISVAKSLSTPMHLLTQNSWCLALMSWLTRWGLKRSLEDAYKTCSYTSLNKENLQQKYRKIDRVLDHSFSPLPASVKPLF